MITTGLIDNINIKDAIYGETDLGMEWGEEGESASSTVSCGFTRPYYTKSEGWVQ